MAGPTLKSLPPPFHRTLSTSIRMYNRLAFNGRRGRYLTVSLPTCRTAGQQVHGFDPMPCRGDDRNAGWNRSASVCKTAGVNRCTGLSLLPQLLLHTATRHVLFRVGLHDGRCQQVHTAQPTAATLAAYSNPSRMILRQSARRQVSTGAHGSNYRLNSYCIFQPVT